MQAIVAELCNIFPQKDRQYLQEVASTADDVSEAVDRVLQEENKNEMEESESLESVLQRLNARVDDDTTTVKFRLGRDCLWEESLLFYKGLNDERLLSRLRIRFDGEEGIDAGAISKEFFGLLLLAIEEKLFEGSSTCRIPRREYGSEGPLFVAGKIISHSIVQGGPGFPCLAPYLYNYLDGGDLKVSVTLEDVCDQYYSLLPMKTFCTKLLTAQTNDAIDELLDEKESEAIVISSGWPARMAINIDSRQKVVCEILHDELVTKRLSWMNAFRNGLKSCGVLKEISQHPDAMRHLFVYSDEVMLTSSVIWSRMTFFLSGSESQEKSFLHEFLKGIENKSVFIPCLNKEIPLLKAFMYFVAAEPHLKQGMTIKVHCDDETLRSGSLPTANACFCRINLPLDCSCQEESSRRMEMAITQCSFGFNMF